MLPFYSCGKAHVSATIPKLFHSLLGTEHDAPLCHYVGAVGRHIIMQPTPSSSARCQNLLCVFHGIMKLSGCLGLTWPSNVTRVDAKDLRCSTRSTSPYGSENHTSPEQIMGRARDAAPSRRSSFLSNSSFSSCAVLLSLHSVRARTKYG